MCCCLTEAIAAQEAGELPEAYNIKDSAENILADLENALLLGAVSVTLTDEEITQAQADALAVLENFERGEVVVVEGEDSELTEALEALQEAKADKVDFLVSEAAADQKLFDDALIITKASDATATKPAAADIETVVGTNATTTLGTLNALINSFGTITATSSEEYNASVIAEAKAQQAAAVAAEQKKVDAVSGLDAAIKALQGAEEAEADAKEVFTTTEGITPDVAVNANIGSFAGLNSIKTTVATDYGSFSSGSYAKASIDLQDGLAAIAAKATPTPVTLVTDGGAKAVVVLNDKGQIVLGADYATAEGAAALLAAVQDEIQALLAVIAGEADVAAQQANVIAAENAFAVTGVSSITLADTASGSVTISKLHKNAAGDLIAEDSTGKFYEVTDVEGAVTDATPATIAITANYNSGEVVATLPATYTEVSPTNKLVLSGEQLDIASATVSGSAPIADAFLTEKSTETNLLDAIQNYQDAKALAAELKGYTDTVVAAEKLLTDSVEDGGFGINLLDKNAFTVENDVFVFDIEGGDISFTRFGDKGQDKIFFGDKYTFTALEDGKNITDKVGDASVLEMFWEETAAGLNLYLENESFAGNVTGSGDIVTVTLTGVSIENVTFEDGYLTAGTIA